MKTRYLNKLSVILLMVFCSYSQAQNTDVLLQGFNWQSCNNNWYVTLNGQVNTIANAGFTVVWMPPPSQGADCGGYRPTQYYNINNSYGNETNLKTLITNFHAKSIKVLADAVINHREGEGCATCFYNPDWGNWSICSNDEYGGSGAQDSGEGYGAARDIDHSNTGVQDGLKYYLKDILKTKIGFDGYRYDYVKGFDGKYIGIYNTYASPYMTVGEYWTSMAYDQPCLFCLNFNQDAHRNKIVSWIEATGNSSFAFDITLKGTLQEAVRTNKYSYLKDASNKPNALIGVKPEKAVTFLDNHDTEGQGQWPFYGDNTTNKVNYILQGYAYLMTHPGLPSVYYDHFFTWGIQTDISKMITIRKNNGIHTQSAVTIEKATDADCYGAVITGTSGKKVALKLGTGSWTPTGASWAVALQGTGYTIWEWNTSGVVYPTISADKASGTYIGGVTITLSCTGANSPTSIYYTLDGTTPSKSSNSLTSGGTVVITTNSTLKAIAIDNAGLESSVLSNTYVTQELGIKVMFYAPASWVAPSIHAWGPAPNYTAITGAWPGVKMTNEGNGWYSYLFNESLTSVNFIFNDAATGGTSKQTVNIENVASNTCYNALETVDANNHNNVVEVSCTVGMNELQNELYQVEVYPNPMNDKLMITSNQLLINDITIINTIGQVVYQMHVATNSYVLLTDQFDQGMYIVKVNTSNGIVIKKIIK